MANPQERSPHEKETLIFPNQEAAQAFREQVGEKLSAPKPAGVSQDQEVVAAAVAQEFTQHGEAVGTLKEPWLHTPAEHEEVQQLVDLAFRRDLGAAIAQARQSRHYPRNLDLLHDVLTGEMYDLLREGKLNRQPLAWGVMAVLIIILLMLIGLLFMVAVF